MRIVPPGTPECLPIQRNSRSAEGWCTYRVHCDAAGEVVSGKTYTEGIVLSRTTHGWFSCGGPWSVAAGDTVAIIGCGGVGLGAVAASRSRGATTICIDVDDEKLELARAAGGAHTINSLRQSPHDGLLEFTGGRGPDVVIEAEGTPTTFRAAVEEVAFTGRVVYIGYAKELVSYETRLFVQKELDVLGSRNAQPEDFQAVIKLLEAGKFPVEQAVSLIVPLDEAAQALRSWSDNPERFKNILVCLD